MTLRTYKQVHFQLNLVKVSQNLSKQIFPGWGGKLTFILEFCSLRYFPAPVMVPPVPIPETSASTFPSEPFHISGPVAS